MGRYELYDEDHEMTGDEPTGRAKEQLAELEKEYTAKREAILALSMTNGESTDGGKSLAQDGESFEHREGQNRAGRTARTARPGEVVAADLGDAELIEAICNPIRKEEAPKKNETLRAYGYIRVSTEEQAKSGLGMAAQKDAIERYCAARSLKLEGFLADEAKSGRSPILSRPHGKLLDDRLAKGDQVILAKHDRGFRNVIDMLKTTENWTERGVVTHICNWSLDTTQPFWKLFAPIAVALAEWEGQMIRERVTEALRMRKRQGRRWGARAPLGFKWVADPKGGRSKKGNPRKIVAVDPKVIEDMRMIARLHDEEGMSFHEIWRSLFYGKVKRSDGREWASPSMICRYYHRYSELKKRRVKEVEGKG